MTSEKEWEEWNLILGRDPVVWEVLTHIVERHLFRESTPPQALRESCLTRPQLHLAASEALPTPKEAPEPRVDSELSTAPISKNASLVVPAQVDPAS